MPQELTEGLDLVWITKTPELLRPILPVRVRIVLYDSEQAFYEYATAKLWVKNFQMVHLLNQGLLKKPEQVYIQMWHGSFGIKKIEGDCGYLNADKAWLTLAKKMQLIRISGFQTVALKRVFTNEPFGERERFWNTGIHGMICFLNRISYNIRERYRRHMALHQRKTVFLYADLSRSGSWTFAAASL